MAFQERGQSIILYACYTSNLGTHTHTYTHTGERDEQITWLLCKFRYIAFCVFVEMQMAITLYQAKRTNERTNAVYGENFSFLLDFFPFFFFCSLCDKSWQNETYYEVSFLAKLPWLALNGDSVLSRRGTPENRR